MEPGLDGRQERPSTLHSPQTPQGPHPPAPPPPKVTFCQRFQAAASGGMGGIGLALHQGPVCPKAAHGSRASSASSGLQLLLPEERVAQSARPETLHLNECLGFPGAAAFHGEPRTVGGSLGFISWSQARLSPALPPSLSPSPFHISLLLPFAIITPTPGLGRGLGPIRGRGRRAAEGAWVSSRVSATADMSHSVTHAHACTHSHICTHAYTCAPAPAHAHSQQFTHIRTHALNRFVQCHIHTFVHTQLHTRACTHFHNAHSYNSTFVHTLI